MAQSGCEETLAASGRTGYQNSVSPGDILASGKQGNGIPFQSAGGHIGDCFKAGLITESGVYSESLHTAVTSIETFGLQQMLQALYQGEVLLGADFHKRLPDVDYNVQAMLLHKLFIHGCIHSSCFLVCCKECWK